MINFYDHQIKDGPALDSLLRTPAGPQRLNLSAADKAALLAFLRTLQDNAITSDPGFSDPLRRQGG